MRISVALTGLLLVLSIITCGCISTTDYAYSGGNTQDATPSSQAAAASISGAKYIRGDIVQPDPSNDAYNSNVAALITEVSDGWYRFNVVVRESASSPWKHLSGYQGGTNTIQNIEIISPNKIGHVDPNSLETVILPTATPTKTIEPGKLQILTHNLEYDIYGIVDVVGTAKNVGGKRISWGTVEVKFYDRDGNMVGNAVDYVQNLDPGETWKFKAMYVDMDGSIHSYKVGVGTVW